MFYLQESSYNKNHILVLHFQYFLSNIQILFRIYLGTNSEWHLKIAHHQNFIFINFTQFLIRKNRIILMLCCFLCSLSYCHNFNKSWKLHWIYFKLIQNLNIFILYTLKGRKKIIKNKTKMYQKPKLIFTGIFECYYNEANICVIW